MARYDDPRTIYDSPTTRYGRGRLSGTSEVSFYLEGFLSFFAGIRGFANFTVNSSGTLGGIANLEGIAPLQFSSTGTVSATGRLEGTIPIKFGGSSTLTAWGDLQGSSEVVFDGTAYIIGRSNSRGTAAIGFGGFARLIGFGDLRGSSLFEFITKGKIKTYPFENVYSGFWNVYQEGSNVGSWSFKTGSSDFSRLPYEEEEDL